jgi:hypothetical protein
MILLKADFHTHYLVAPAISIATAILVAVTTTISTTTAATATKVLFIYHKYLQLVRAYFISQCRLFSFQSNMHFLPTLLYISFTI